MKMRNDATIRPSSGAHKAEESKYRISQPQKTLQLQEIPHNTKRTRDQILGFEDIATGDTLETTSSKKTSITAAVSQKETHPRELVTNNGMAEGRIRRTPTSVSRFLDHADDGQTLFRFSRPPPRSPFQRLFKDLESLGLAPLEESPEGAYGEEQPSQGTPQHRNIGQSLDEILYLPSCG